MIYAFKNQTLDDHVRGMLDYWEKIKHRYLNCIIRALKAYSLELSPEEADEFMKMLIRLHDIGKASKIYQKHILEGESLRGFRHEFVSSYYSYKLIKKRWNNEKLAFIGALTIMLHHEPIIMGQITNMKKEELTAEVVLDKLGQFDGMVKDTERWLIENIGEDLKEPGSEELTRFVFEMSIKARHFPDSEKLRLIVGVVLIPLVMCDYAGAKEREGKAPKFAKVLEVEGYAL